MMASLLITLPSAAPAQDNGNANTVPYLAIGNVIICREAVISADAENGVLFVRLALGAANQLAEETAANVGKSLKIRLGNTVLIDDLIVHEPIKSGQFTFFGYSPSEILKMQKALKIPCPGQK